MRSSTLLPLALGLVASLSSAASAASLDVNGIVQCTEISGTPWVLTSVMWADVTTGSFTGIGSNSFASIADPAKFTATYGDLEIDYGRSQSPGGATPGFEYYTELDSNTQPFLVYYDNVLWASGTTEFMRTYVDDNLDTSAIGTGRAYLTSSTPSGAAFFAEVLALSGGTGRLDFAMDSFFAINNAGLFGSTGTMAAIPEPASAAALAGLAALGLRALRRRRR